MMTLEEIMARDGKIDIVAQFNKVKAERKQWETLATEALADAGEWKGKCRQLREALQLARATIERLQPGGMPFSSVKGTFDVIDAALAGKE